MSVNVNMLNAWAKELGFAQIALCSIEDFSRQEEQVRRQAPLAERRQLRFSVSKDDLRARSLAVMLWPYLPAGQKSNNTLFVDSYYKASNAAYHAARELEARLAASGHFAKANCSYPAKAAAVRAGLGFIGKNDLLFTEKYGTRIVIILMLTDLEACDMPPKRPLERTSCFNCGRCAAACPSGALDENGMSHPERCMRNFMMEGIVVPPHLRERMGQRLLGCDICQRVCPMQPALEQSCQSEFSLEGFVTDDQTVFSNSIAALALEIGRNAARPQRVRAQAALLAGNSRNAFYLPVLRKWAELPFEAVSEHAKWAIDKLELERRRT